MLQAIWNADPSRLALKVVVALGGASGVELLQQEQALLDAARVGKNRACLNVLPVAGSPLGVKKSPATLRKMAEAATGRVHSPESREKMRMAKIGRKLTPEHRAKIGAAARGKRVDRPTGIINRRLRAFTDDDIRALRARRNAGESWRMLTVGTNRNFQTVRRATLGHTYRELI